MAECDEKAAYLLRYSDAKFTKKFDAVLKGEGIKVKKLPFASSNLNAYAERFVQSTKSECLDQFVVFGERRVEYLIREDITTRSVPPGLENKPIGSF